MNRLLSLLLVLPLAACSSVKPEDIDSFGMVWSASRVHWSEAEAETLVITNVSGYCGKQQAYQDAYQEYFDTYTDLIEDLNYDDWCSDLYEPALAMADEGRKLSYDGAHYLQVSVADEFEDEEYDFPEDASGFISYITEDTYDALIEDWDEDGDAEDNCGLDIEEDSSDYWVMDGGSIDVTSAENDSAVVGSYDVDIIDEDGDDEGSVTGSFRGAYCEIEEAH